MERAERHRRVQFGDIYVTLRNVVIRAYFVAIDPEYAGEKIRHAQVTIDTIFVMSNNVA